MSELVLCTCSKCIRKNNNGRFIHPITKWRHVKNAKTLNWLKIDDNDDDHEDERNNNDNEEENSNDDDDDDDEKEKNSDNNNDYNDNDEGMNCDEDMNCDKELRVEFDDEYSDSEDMNPSEDINLSESEVERDILNEGLYSDESLFDFNNVNLAVGNKTITQYIIIF